jgi:hypothetical protein
MVMKKLTLLLAVIILAACAKTTEYEEYLPTEVIENTAQEMSADQAIPVSAPDRKIVRSGNISIEVSDLEKAKAAVDTLVALYGAYYNSDSYMILVSVITYDLNIRIPSASFDEFIAAVESGIGKVTHKNTFADDVTELDTDIVTRLANKRTYLGRYRDLLARAATVRDMVEIENSIRVITEEIESMEGRLRYLSNQVEYSTLSLHISQPTAHAVTRNFGEKISAAITSGWRGLVSVMIVVVHLWPLYVAAAIVLIILKRRKK